MPKASAVAIELRKLADALDREPEALVVRPTVSFTHWDGKELFIGLVKLLPRPLAKSVDGGKLSFLYLTHTTDALLVDAGIQQETMCRLVKPAQPAIYECEPILSQEDHASLGVE